MASVGSKEVFTCSFGNLSSVATVLREFEDDIYIIPAGGIRDRNIEDDLCAESLLTLLQGRKLEIQSHGPELLGEVVSRQPPLIADRLACLKIDRFPIVPFVSEWAKNYARLNLWRGNTR